MHCQLMMSVFTLHLAAIVQICHSRNQAAFFTAQLSASQTCGQDIEDIEVEVADD